jgi:hypothetical protein
MVSLPIPDAADGTIRYADLSWRSGTVLDLLHQLGYRRYDHDAVAHLDPDLVAARYPRLPDWQPLFGQAGAAAAHLMANNVGAGDLFLFWGLFCHTREQEGRLQSVGRPFHTIYGYLEVEIVLDAGAGECVAFAPEFPHFRKSYLCKTCRVYVARPLLCGTDLPGSAVFRYHPGLRLTAPDAIRLTDWRLPACFHPQGGTTLSYHSASHRWGPAAQGLTSLTAASRGQEFVASPSANVTAWARALIAATERTVE